MSGYPDDRDRDDPDRDERERDNRGDRRDDEEDIARAKSAVTAPAIGLIVVGVLMLLAVVLNLVQLATIDPQFDEQIKKIENDPQIPDNQKKEQVRMMNQIRDFVKVAILPYLGLVGLFAVIVLIGGVKMLNLSGSGLVYFAAILAMLPCTICCVLGLVFGIWALVVMGKPEVKAGFAARRRLSSGSY